MSNDVNNMNYLVKAVTVEDDYILLVDFIDGARKRFDMKPIIARGGVFERLKNVDFFKKSSCRTRYGCLGRCARYCAGVSI